MLRLSKSAVAVSIALTSMAAFADDSSKWFSLRGFGTAALIKNTADNTYYRTSPTQPSGARDGWDGGTLNRLGVQASITPYSWLEGTLQMLSFRRYDDSYDPDVEWAFVKIKPTNDFSVRFGRMVLPVFMVSETRNVGYAQTMTTPPIDVYTQALPRKFDGIDANWRLNAGEVSVNVTPYFGRRREPVGSGTVITQDRIRGFNATAEWTDWIFRAGYAKARMLSRNEPAIPLWGCMQGESTAISAACPAYAAAVPVAGQVAREFNVQHKDVTFAGLGLQFDNGKYVFAAEMTERKQDTYFPDVRGWYMMGAYRVKSFTPYLSTSRLKNVSPVSDSRLSSASAGPFAPLNAVIAANVNASLRAVANDQKTLSAGLRWDVYKNTALKFQYDRIRITDNLGSAFKMNAGSSTSPLMHVYSATFDFVF